MTTRKLFGSARRQFSVISRSETIKPASPTPSPFKRYNLTSQDQISPAPYIPFALFYPYSGFGNPKKFASKSHQLKSSLSKALTQYYPFAGRLTSQAYIDCNDEGVEFLESRVRCLMSEILDNYEGLDSMFPPGSVWGKLENTSSLAVVQFTHFDCGGMALAVGLTHRIADGCTFANFLRYWAALTRETGDEVHPYYVRSSASDDSVMFPEFELPEKNWVTRRLVFPNSKLATLKAIVAAQGVKNPTRVEVMTALICKSALAAAKLNSGSLSPSVLFQPANMRPILDPPLPETTAGNYYWRYNLEIKNESESELSELVDKIKIGKMKLKGMKHLDGKEYWSTVIHYIMNNYRIYLCSSFCHFPFYEVDFGWGKPVRVIMGESPTSNNFILMDVPDGIEAMISLDQPEMAIFQQNKEVLEFSST